MENKELELLNVVANPGNIILSYTKPAVALGEKAIPNRTEHFTTLEALRARADVLSAAGCDLYFTPATMPDRSRSAKKAKGANAVWVDVDYRDTKGFATREEATAGIKAFLVATSLPSPTVVSSGAGFHLYWHTTENLKPKEWVECAKALHLMVRRLGGKMKSDTARITDIASLMRLPGYMNNKRGAIAQTLRIAPPIDVATFRELFNYEQLYLKYGTDEPVAGASAQPAPADDGSNGSAVGGFLATKPSYLRATAGAGDDQQSVPSISAGGGSSGLPTITLTPMGGHGRVSVEPRGTQPVVEHAPRHESSAGSASVGTITISGGSMFGHATPITALGVSKAAPAKPKAAGALGIATKPSFAQLLTNCGIIRHYAVNQNEASEAVWKMSLNCIAQCIDGDEAAHVFSREYSGYSHSETTDKLQLAASFDRPVSCDVLRGLAADKDYLCAICPNKNANATPVRGATRHIVDAPTEEAIHVATRALAFQALVHNNESARVNPADVAIPAQPASTGGAKLPPGALPRTIGVVPLNPATNTSLDMLLPLPPKGYVFGTAATGSSGIFTTNNERITPNLIWVDRRVTTIGADSSPVSYLVSFVRSDGIFHQSVLPGSDMSKKSLETFVTHNGLGASNAPQLADYISAACQLQADSNDTPLYATGSYGWHTFGPTQMMVLPDCVVYPDGRTVEVIARGDNGLTTDGINKEATIEGWKNAIGVLYEGMPSAQLILLAAMASPIIHIRNDDGLSANAMIVFLSGFTAAGKSFLSSACKSIWGKPSHEIQGGSTLLSLQKLAGKYRHMPMFVDDMLASGRGPEDIRDFVTAYPQGREKNRMTKDSDLASSLATWSNLLIVSSNMDLNALLEDVDLAGASRARMFEMYMEPITNARRNRPEVTKATEDMYKHYQVVGRELAARMLRMGKTPIYNRIKEVHGDMLDRTSAKEHSTFRFILKLMACCQVAAEIAGDLLPFDPKPAIDWGVMATAHGVVTSPDAVPNQSQVRMVKSVMNGIIGSQIQVAYRTLGVWGVGNQFATNFGGDQVGKISTMNNKLIDGKQMANVILHTDIGGSAVGVFVSKSFVANRLSRASAVMGVSMRSMELVFGPKASDGVPRFIKIDAGIAIGSLSHGKKTEYMYLSVREYEELGNHND